MAKVTLESVEQFSSNQQNLNQVGFFGLKDDGEEAVVRFLVDSMDDIDILTLHDVNVGGRYMKVSCNRKSLSDNPSTCAFCSSGTKMAQKAFIKMLSYTKTPTGEVFAKPCVWERSTSYAIKLREYLNNYGPLSDIICKVVRHGAKGDLKTTYEIIPNLNKSIYPDTTYVKDFSAFNTYEVLGTIVKEKTNNDINVYLQTGQFPEVNNGTNGEFLMGDLSNHNLSYTGNAVPQASVIHSGSEDISSQAQQFEQSQVVQPTVAQTPSVSIPVQQIPQQQMPWQQAQQIQRPIRTY